jgi:mannosyltransferase OCH1-like enzyme
MAIPKTIYQTFKSEQLPWLTQWHIHKLKNRNPEFDYQFYTDDRIAAFIASEYGSDVFALYNRINIGAAKADFFRYAILYAKGGVYLDIDSLNVTPLEEFILPDDSAIISMEKNLTCYVQWALIFEAKHPFLAKTLESVLANLSTNKYPHDVHQMTGPSAYTKAIQDCLQSSPSAYYRQLGVDYEGHFKFHYRFSKFFLYGAFRKGHWRKEQREVTVLNSR